MMAKSPGLSAEEAARRLLAEGPNVLPEARNRFLAIMIEALTEPMFLLLIAAALLYLLLGDLHEGLLLVFMVAVTIGLTLYQEGKTERALEALRDLSSPRALVLRNGKPVRIAGRDVVREDVLLLSEGERVAADAILMEVQHLRVDESLLTGESVPVDKRAARTDEKEDAASPGGDDLPFVWSGTLVVQGSGMARVTATGPRSAIGKIGGALGSLSTERSPLQSDVTRLIAAMATFGIGLSLIVAIVYGVLHGEWLQAVLVGISLSMSLLPEEYSVILTVFPAIGAWRLSRVSVLTRRLAAIETLGAVSVLCTDKTGTLTENRMTVTQLQVPGGRVHVEEEEEEMLPPQYVELATYAFLASKPRPFDPMEKAFHQLAERLGVSPEPTRWTLLREYPLSPGLHAMTQVWQAGEVRVVAAKGAPEAIALLCHLDEVALEAIRAAVDGMAAQGLRVLAVARAEASVDALPSTQEGFEFRYLGLLGLTDPLRPEIPEAVRQCKEAGIRVMVVTGDYPGTANAIARQAGLPEGDVLSGSDMRALGDAELAERLRATNVCARITPDQKLRIVQALKADGAIVAMTGDGVNDAPALKAAHVGIAMGGRGTDIAREAAALVLLDDNFASIVRGIRLGRRIFSNMQNAMAYVLSIHIPIAGMALLPILFGWPILLYPMQLAFLELIVDPACSLAFENQSSDSDTMQRPPRGRQRSLIDKGMWLQALLQGGGAFIVSVMSYAWAIHVLPEQQARAVAFTVMVVANLALIFSNLSHRRSVLYVLNSANKVPVIVAAGALGVLLLTLYFPLLAQAFRFAPLQPQHLAMALLWGAATILWFEAVKLVAHPAKAAPNR